MGPLLFNIFINDMLHLVGEAEICNYADDTTIYACDTKIERVIDKLDKHSFEIASCFSNIFMKLNEEKWHVMLYDDKSNDHSVNVGQALIKESSEEKLLEVTLNKRLSFETHTQQLCVKASQKLHALATVSPFMESKKLVAITNAFITSQFSYCPLRWMFRSHKTDHKISRIH